MLNPTERLTCYFRAEPDPVNIPLCLSLSVSVTLPDPRGTRPGESGEDGAAVEVPAKHSRQAAEPRHHAERSVTHTRSGEFHMVVTAICLSIGNIQAVMEAGTEAKLLC